MEDSGEACQSPVGRRQTLSGLCSITVNGPALDAGLALSRNLDHRIAKKSLLSCGVVSFGASGGFNRTNRR